MLCFHSRPLSELQLKRGITIGVKTYRQGLGRRAMECRGLARGLLLWDRHVQDAPPETMKSLLNLPQ